MEYNVSAVMQRPHAADLEKVFLYLWQEVLWSLVPWAKIMVGNLHHLSMKAQTAAFLDFT